MSAPPQITVEDDAPPIVRVIANTLKSSASRPAGRQLINSIQGSFALASTTDPQAVTVKIKDGCIELITGVARGTDIVLHVDFGKLNNPKYKPKIDGLIRHPYLTYKVGKLLSLPPPNWADSAKRFWAVAYALPDMPPTLKITCTDEARSLSFGESEGESEGEADTEIVSDSGTLAQILAGNTLLINEVLAGKARIRTSMQHFAGLNQAGIKMLMGEIDG